jgi:eukaryotic-like serine/threonine-protein kinase
VKPGNLLVRPNGTLVLTDFGIARSAGAAQLTAAGSVLGTASYISPEQAMGEQATPLSDIYALGVVAYQCLAGHRPFEGENPLEIAMRHVREVPPPLPADIPPTVRGIVERAMAKAPTARWPTAAAFAAVARRAAAELGGTAGRLQAGAGAATPAATPGQPARAGGHGPVTPTPTPTSPGVPAGVPGHGSTRAMGAAAAGQAPRPVPPGVAAGQVPAGYLRGGPAPGYVQMRPQRQTSTGLIIAIIVAVVLVAVCVGAGIAIVQGQQNGATSIGRAATAYLTNDSEGLRR